MDASTKWVGIPVLLLLVVLFGLVMSTRAQTQHYEAINTMRADPDRFRFPICTADNGWGLGRSMHDYTWYLIAPDNTLTEIHGDWRQYRARLPNMTCDEQ